MKTINILVPEAAVPAAIVDPQYMFTAVNTFFQQAGRQPFFKVQLVGVNKEIVLNGGGVVIRPDVLLHEVKESDLVIVPAIGGNIAETIAQNSVFFPWIVEQHKNGSEVASLCTGAFLLASTGLLDEKLCSTHWLFASEFRTRFPKIRLADDKIITDQNGLYSSGGANSYWNLLLYLVEKYVGREMAVVASKFFLLDIDRNSQLPFSMFKGQKEHGDDLIVSVQEHIEKYYQERITIEELAHRFGIGRRTLERKFKKYTSNTLIEYIQRVKVEAAKKELEKGRKTVNEVMYEVGYNDSKTFREVFKKVTGMSPIDYRMKFNSLLMDSI